MNGEALAALRPARRRALVLDRRAGAGAPGDRAAGDRAGARALSGQAPGWRRHRSRGLAALARRVRARGDPSDRGGEERRVLRLLSRDDAAAGRRASAPTRSRSRRSTTSAAPSRASRPVTPATAATASGAPSPPRRPVSATCGARSPRDYQFPLEHKGPFDIDSCLNCHAGTKAFRTSRSTAIPISAQAMVDREIGCTGDCHPAAHPETRSGLASRRHTRPRRGRGRGGRKRVIRLAALLLLAVAADPAVAALPAGRILGDPLHVLRHAACWSWA